MIPQVASVRDCGGGNPVGTWGPERRWRAGGWQCSTEALRALCGGGEGVRAAALGLAGV